MLCTWLKSWPGSCWARDAERGQALLLFALGLAVFAGMVALAIDVGAFLQERRSLQNAADAAALAGAVELPGSAALAETKAQDWAGRNGIGAVSGDSLDITFSDGGTSITVTVGRSVGFSFGRVLGVDGSRVQATATARVGAPSAMVGVMPFGVLKEAIKYDGTPTTMKYDAGNPSNGNFAALRVDGPGAKIHEESIKYGSKNMVCVASQPSCQDPAIDTQTGNMVGPTRDGIKHRLANTKFSCDEMSEVLELKADGTYRVRPECNPWQAEGSNRLLVVPVVKKFCNGSCSVTLEYFTLMFLEELGKCTGNSCEVKGIFVKAFVDPEAELGLPDVESAISFVRLVE